MIMITIVLVEEAIETTGTMGEMAPMIEIMTMTAAMTPEAMGDVDQIHAKETIIIIIMIVAVQDVIAPHAIVDIVKIVKANMVQRNLVNAIMIAVVVETAIEIMIVIIVNLREEKAHQDVRKRKNKLPKLIL